MLAGRAIRRAAPGWTFRDDIDYIDAADGFGCACNGFHLYVDPGAYRAENSRAFSLFRE